VPDQVPDQVGELPQAGLAHAGTAVNWSLLFVTLGALL
jgi:hypothetical protein